jgi:predicted DNA-binding ribbon-helix-helix protein
MCEIFAGQNPKNYAFETRSVRLMGHVTSVKLETKFWEVIEDIADAQNMTQAQFLTQLYSEALEIHGEISNFASLLRCCCLMFKSGSVEATDLLHLETAQAS